MYKHIYILFFLFFSLTISAQTINGSITDNNKEILPGANILIQGENFGVSSDNNGKYLLELKANRSVIIEVSFIGFGTKSIRIPMLKKGQNYTLNIQLSPEGKLIDDVIVRDKKSRKQALSKIKTQHVSLIPNSGGGVESVLKTLPGVSSANELSSQYSVRGGNFDENMVYVNGIEVYRPFLVHSGQQEGLSFVNSDMVENILFSAGGFESKYGDKMSSVLDITYKNPTKTKASINLSLLGGSAHLEGISPNNRFTYLVGFRNKSNQYLLNAMDTKAEYKPNFSDLQTLFKYQIKDNWEVSLLTNISENTYRMVPRDRDTEFGTLNEALKLRIYFEGQESDKYNTYFAAFNSKFSPNLKTKINITTSAFKTIESESFDILGEYWLFQLDNNLGSDNFGDVKFDRGVGKFINHARNNLEATVINTSLNGHYISNENTKWEWGIKWQKEDISDQIKEWTLIDSAGFTLPHPHDNIGGISDTNQQVMMTEFLKTNIDLSSVRNSAYLQINKEIGNFSINAGTRASYWSFNNEKLISPRLNIAYIPLWEKDVVFRAATGIYYQSPFYRELRNMDGELNPDIESQKSTHFVLGSDYLFYAWGRPFKLVSEVYYKDLDNLIPYKVDNVRIQYLAENNSHGYATGIDMKINGEFVSGVESWASVSVMQTKEDIEGDFYIDNEIGETIYPGFIPRPTDQRVNFSMFFQDYLPGNPNYKMHLSMMYGTGLPFGPPNAEKFNDILRMPDYRRVDIGFSAVIKAEDKKSKIGFLNNLNNMWISAEVFNLLDIDNTVSYLWVADVSGRQYAVPNYLTPRLLNFKLIIGI
ncbi:MAG: TonB-dependent receptor plug domain-containing protein [Flavobacteriales bacterium]|nr:TonB-dependent receptor plug domain-containing protein [Flavobacteriales bacterium]